MEVVLIKDFLLGFSTLLSTLFTSPIEYKNDQKVAVEIPGQWEVVEQSVDKKGYGTFTAKGKNGETFTAEFVPLPKREKEGLGILPAKDKNALQIMREYRSEELRTNVPNSIWKLIEAKNEDDVIFEWYIPQNSVYDTMYRIERFIIGSYGYHKLALEVNKERPQDREAWIATLKNMEVNVGLYERNSPKHYS